MSTEEVFMNILRKIRENKVMRLIQRLPKPRMPKWFDTFWHSEKMGKFFEFLNKQALFLHIPMSMFIVFCLEWMSRHSFMAAVQFTIDHTGAYVYNCFVVFAIYSLVFLFQRRTFIRLIITAVFAILGLINCILLLNRVSPFGFTDFNMVGDLLTMQDTKYFEVWQGLIIVACLIIFLLLMIRLFLRGPKAKSRFPFLLRAIMVVCCFISIPFVTKDFQRRGILTTYFGNLALGYQDYGYLYGFGSSIFGLGMKEPEGYSQATVQNIVKKTSQPQSRVMKVNGKKVNIVVVLLESYFDPTEAKFLEMDRDPIPYFHRLEKNYSTGHLRVPVLGAGTCNTEFEVLTGMSTRFFGPGEYLQKTILKKTDCESYAANLTRLGYNTHVIHNNGANFYSRQNSFSMMGFHDFVSKEMLNITQMNPISTWPTDGVLIKPTMDAMNEDSNPDFTYTITVATHGNYPDYPVFDETQSNVIKVNAKGKDEALNNKWKYYVNMLHREDTWIKNYISMLAQRDEPTLVLMFGDHLPTMDLHSNEVKTKDLYLTKYITWNNFNMKKKDKDLTSYNLVAEYCNRLGIHGGTLMNYHQTRIKQKVKPEKYRYNKGLYQLQYDLLYGKRYAYGGQDKYPATEVVMGVHDIALKRMDLYEDEVHLYGKNFTKWSQVYVNGEPVETTYNSGHYLTISAKNVKDSDTVVVKQMGSGEDDLRTSNTYIYRAPADEDQEKESLLSRILPGSDSEERNDGGQQ